MAQAEAEAPEEKELKKEVTLVAYSNDHARILEQFIEDISGVDVTETKTDKTEKWELEISLDDGSPYTATVPDYMVDKDRADELIESLEEAGIGDVKLNRSVEMEQLPVNTHSDAGATILETIFENIPNKIDGMEKEYSRYSLKYMDDDNESKIRIRSPDFANMRILAKESEREHDDLYETMAERPAAEFEIIINASSDDEMNRRTNEIIPKIHRTLSSLNGIGKVRYMACTIKEEREGECYNI